MPVSAWRKISIAWAWRRQAGCVCGSTFQTRGQVLDVRGVLPVAEGRELAVAAGLARVLRGRLAVHLEDRAARLADHAAQEIEVVHLAGRRRRLVRLINALQDGGDQRRRHCRAIAAAARSFAAGTPVISRTRSGG